MCESDLNYIVGETFIVNFSFCNLYHNQGSDSDFIFTFLFLFNFITTRIVVIQGSISKTYYLVSANSTITITEGTQIYTVFVNLKKQ